MPAGRHKFEIRDLKQISNNSHSANAGNYETLPRNLNCFIQLKIVFADLTSGLNQNSDISTDDIFEKEASEAVNRNKEKLISNPKKQAIEKPSRLLAIKESNAVQNHCISNSFNNEKNEFPQSIAKDDDCDTDDTSMMTVTAESCTDSLLKSPENDETDVFNDAFKRQQQNMRKEFFMRMDELKFANTVKICSENLTLLEEETSPTDSLVSSDSGEALMRKKVTCKTMFEEIEEHDLEGTSNHELDNVVSLETPVDVSNSMSLSDDGNKDEFLIDDDIYSPYLRLHEDSPYIRLHEDMKEAVEDSYKSLTALNDIRTQNILASTEKKLEGSTLSLQNSISSDDLMGDFSIDR